jgi:dynein heavy chain
MFEVIDLSVASPATVSRAGMVYMDADDLGWGVYVETWLFKNFPEVEERNFFSGLFDKYVKPLCAFRMKEVKETVPITEFNGVMSLCNLFSAIRTTPINGCDATAKAADSATYYTLAEKWFTWSVVWSLCAAADEIGRRRFDWCLRDIDGQFPIGATVYDYYVEPNAGEWKPWEEKVPRGLKASKDTPFFKIIVPTVDTVRNSFVVNNLIRTKVHTLLVGNTGVGKTVLALQELDNLPDTHSKLIMYFSSATSSNSCQDIIESAMEKRSKDKYGPPGGKKLVTFIDDLNMPTMDEFGSQPPLELLRQWVDYESWYDRGKQQLRYIMDMQLLAAMGPPGGGRSVISERLQSRFNILNLTQPADSQLQRIFEYIINPRLAEMDDDIKSMGPMLVKATVALYTETVETFLPTPEKCHYLFNMRDMSKVIQGCLRMHADIITNREAMLRLWVHECLRVFSDRLVSLDDQAQFRELVGTRLSGLLDADWVGLMGECTFGPDFGPVFQDMDGGDDDAAPGAESTDVAPYSEVADRGNIKEKLEEKLADYNLEGKVLPMNLVLFGDALLHCLRIARILRTPRGNALLVGVGGSGRQSMTRLAAYVVGGAEMTVFTIEITKNYRRLVSENFSFFPFT